MNILKINHGLKRIILSSVFFCLGIAGIANISLAAIGPSLKSKDQELNSIIRLPMQNGYQVLKKKGSGVYPQLVRVMFDDRETMELRWRAMMLGAKLVGPTSVPDLEKAMQNSAWFMRNAGLVAISQVDQQRAIQWAKRLISDSALLVRAAAVDVLAKSNKRESMDLLWSKLYAPENYRGKQSLFIRRQIAEKLLRHSRPGDEAKWIKALADRDRSISVLAIGALENMTGQSFKKEEASLDGQRSKWNQWWSQRSRL